MNGRTPTITIKPLSGRTEDLTRSKISFDGGNGGLKWINPLGQIQLIPSYYLEIPDYQDFEVSDLDSESILIEEDGRRYLLGNMAKEMGGHAVFEQDKLELMSLTALAAIEPSLGQKDVIVGELAIALPDSRSKIAVAAAAQLQGERSFHRNGKLINATIKHVVPTDETRGAFKYARLHDLFQYPDMLNAVVDLGRGTSIGRVYNPKGVLIREADAVLPGTYELARAIASYLLPKLGQTPDLALIMEGIERGDYRYGGGRNATYFEPEFRTCVAKWLTATDSVVRSRLRSVWSNLFDQIGSVMIIGGSAPLAKPWVESDASGRLFIPENPRFINLLGMALD